MTNDLVRRLREEQPVTQDMESTAKCDLQDEAADRIEELEAELDTMKTGGIIEVAVRNPSVSDYMTHWEGRAELAEAKLAKATDGLRECEEEIDDYVRQEYPGEHPVQARYRARDFAANPARAALTELKGTDQ